MTKASGVCGYNNVSRPSADRRPNYECPQGYSFLDPNDQFSSCKPNFIWGCNDRPYSSEDSYYIEELPNTDCPFSDYMQLQPFSEGECRNSCLQDCMCSAAIFRDQTCWKKKLPLSNGRTDTTEMGKAFIKVCKVGAIFLGFFFIYKKRVKRIHQVESEVETNLRCFSYKELAEATTGFKEELGRGTFGVVFKGEINIGSGNFVAVKKLDRMVQER
ncbi:hypothetical protein F0562_001395 [Nyssa sinensis]|uniref:Apple domain-containing protein n=1 Tax=Nyssa sinensis TaxID=561372 RepID=A0A5J5C6T0_9ASTE|nr:hypothetical protein F0562_001395 [Nyssa sinensis]